jgi:uncharacterized protein (TIGR03437 family)
MSHERALVLLWLVLIWTLPAPCQSAAPELGEPPRFKLDQPAPVIQHRLGEGASQAGGWINVFTREAVRLSYNNLIATSNNVEMGWTGSVNAGNAGTTAAAYRDAVLARINWFRAMVGVPPVGWDASLEPEQQQAALMMSANRRTSHMPDANWPQYTAAGAAAAGVSNLCILFPPATNPGCVDSYIDDNGVNNTAAGHRRWLLHPQTLRLATGDVSAADTFPSANVLRAYDANLRGPRPATREPYVAWPPNGFVPYQAMPNRWSFGFPAADFQNATVTLLRRGVNVPAVVEPLATGFGENTIVFVPDGLPPGGVPAIPKPEVDTATTVIIRNVLISGQRRDFTYTVIVFDPDSAGPLLSGPAVPSNESVVHGATLRSADLSPNGFGTVYGTNLAVATRSWDQSFQDGRAPTDLSGTMVLINDRPAFIAYTQRGADFGIGFDQINFISPEDDSLGPVTLVVVTPAGRSAPRTVNLSSRSPAFFPFGPRGQRYIAAIENSGTYLAGPSDLFGGPVNGIPVRGAIANDPLQFFGAGFGGTDPPAPVGQLPTIVSRLDAVRVLVGNIVCEVYYAGLSPYAGVYQIVIRTPNLPPGEYPVYAEIAGRRTQDGLFLLISAP